MGKTEKQWRSVAWAIWLIPMALVVGIVISNPLARSVTPIYHDAVTNWWAQQPVYTGSSGFNYLPLFLPGFGLFALLPLVICEILWRWAALAGLGFGLWRCTNLIASKWSIERPTGGMPRSGCILAVPETLVVSNLLALSGTSMQAAGNSSDWPCGNGFPSSLVACATRHAGSACGALFSGPDKLRQ